MYVVLDKKTLNYSEQFDAKKECYAIVGSLQNGSLTSLEKILLRLEKIAKYNKSLRTFLK